jgi:hypothetical protein
MAFIYYIAVYVEKHPQDPQGYHLTGFTWDNMYYYDKCLPMGCSSSCKIFETFSSAILWILRHKFGVTSATKILDDFFFTGRSESLCRASLFKFQALCEHLGIPITHEKTMGPSNEIVFWGLQLNSVQMIAKLPEDKL